MTGSVIGDVLGKRRFVELPPTVSAAEAAKMMVIRRVSAVLVTEQGRLVGILTESDIVKRVVAAGLDIDTTKLRRVMTRDPIAVTPETPILTAIKAMKELGLRHLPVTRTEAGERGSAVLGVVSVRDFVGEDVAALARDIKARKEAERAALTPGAAV